MIKYYKSNSKNQIPKSKNETPNSKASTDEPGLLELALRDGTVLDTFALLVQ